MCVLVCLMFRGESLNLEMFNPFWRVAQLTNFPTTTRSCSGSEEAEGVTFDPTAIDCQQLVLDVPEGTRVKLGRKEAGRRSQLWRMTSTGMLQHEGSSPPYDPTSKKAQKRSIILVRMVL